MVIYKYTGRSFSFFVIMRIAMIFLMFSVFLQVRGQENYSFEQISLQQGLSQASVKSILRDAYGMLWIGTESGLNRYDASEMRNYYHNPDDEGSLPSNYIYFIEEDVSGQLWIGTSRGLVGYNRQNDKFDTSLPLTDNEHSIFSNALKMGESILFGSNTHLVDYNANDKSCKRILLSGIASGLPLNYSMVQWHSHSVLLASRWKGLFICDLNTGLVESVEFDNGQRVMAAFMDGKKRLWLAHYQEGVKVYDGDGHLIKHYTSSNSALNNNIVLDIHEVDGRMWLGTDGGGINVVDASTDEISFVENIPENKKSIPVNSISIIYQDKLSEIWLGTIRGGVLNVKQSLISFYEKEPLNSIYGLSDQTVLCFFEDENEQIWLGTDGGGINLYNPKKRTFKHFPNTQKYKVNAIAKLSKNRLLVGCYGQGLMVFNITSGRLSELPNLEKEEYDINTKAMGVNLASVDEDNILLFDDRIYKYNSKQQTIDLLDTRNIINGEGQLRLADSGRGVLWLLYGQKGIYQLNVQTFSIKLLFQVQRGEQIRSVCRDDDMDIWLGTSSGLYWLDPTTLEYSKMEVELSNGVNSVVDGDNGQIWFGNSGKLMCYNKVNQIFYTFGRSDGVMPNDYITRSSLHTQQGDVFLGGVTGMVHIHQMKLPEFTPTPKVNVIEVIEDGSLANVENYKRFLTDKQIILPYNYNSLRIRLSIVDQFFFDEKLLKYKIEGYGDQYVLTDEPVLDFSKLPNGHFPILIKTKAKNGLWSAPIELITIKINPPWWSSWWFISILLMVLLFVGIVFRNVTYRRHRNKLKLQLSEKEKIINEQKVKFLINISHEFRTPLSLIYSPLERLISDDLDVNTQNALHRLMFRQVKYIKELLNQVLDIHKFDKVGIELQVKKTHLNTWLQQCTKEFKYEFEASNITLDIDLDNYIHDVEFDAAACSKVIYNFLSNALKYASESQQVRVFTALKEEGYVLIGVQDQGKGINAGSEDKIFERFYQGGEQKGGIGVGLAFSKTIVELHYGKIGVENIQPHGALFYFQLPLKQTNLRLKDTSDNLPLEEKEDVRINKDMLKHLTLLIVEDETELLNYLKEQLGETFRKVFTAANGKEALLRAREEKPDLVISDVMMPEMDGFEFCKTLKNDIEISHIPVVLLTARQDEEGTKIGYKMGADAYITKPFSIDTLKNLLLNILLGRMRMKERLLKYQDTQAEEITYSNADEDFVIRLNGIIMDELSNIDLGVDLLVDKMGISRASLYTKIKTVLGVSINHYINGFRMKESIKLLAQKDLSIVEISELVGFRNQAYFSTSFKQHKGLSPLKYRNQIE